MKVLFLDCFSGISGDMTVGALVDLGVKPSTLEWELSKLNLGDFHMHFDRQQRKNVSGVKFGIHAGATHRPEQDAHGEEAHEHAHAHTDTHSHEHAHSEEHSHSHEHSHTHEHTHSHEGHEHVCSGHHHHEEEGHEHDHDHGHEVHTEHHTHDHDHAEGRSYREIRALIEQSELSEMVRTRALAIFHRIAVAEGHIHGVPAEEVAFHEVGALDSIADIVCACVGIEALGVEQVFVSHLQDGCGTIDCAHGTFPVPAPATLEILKGIPLAQIDEPHELITPTGAAIAAEFASAFGPMPKIKAEKIGYGLGTRELESRPNVLRAVLGELVLD
jgi:uncharacterized protein (DUF111 family)